MRSPLGVVKNNLDAIKLWIGSSGLQAKTLKQVSTEMALHVLGYNSKRVRAWAD